MQDEWEKYLLSKIELQALPKYKKKKPKAPKGFGVLDGVIPSGQKADVTSINKLENDALLAAAYEKRKQGKRDTDAKDGGTNEEHGKGKKNGRKPKKQMIDKTDPGSENSILYETPPVDHGDKINDHDLSMVGHLLGEAPENKYADRSVLRKHDQGPENESSCSLPSVHFHALESDQSLLDILQPSIIIVYHPDIAFVREIEIYKSENPSRLLKVYFLFYEDSTEVQKFEASIRRENAAFESLIRQKSLMMIPVSQVCYFTLLYFAPRVFFHNVFPLFLCFFCFCCIEFICSYSKYSCLSFLISILLYLYMWTASLTMPFVWP